MTRTFQNFRNTTIFSEESGPTIDHPTKSRIILELQQLRNAISWNSLGEARTIKSAIAEIEFGKDIGWQQTALLMPATDDFHDWMDYAYLLTRLHNRELSPKRFTLLRKAIINRL